MTVIFEEGLRSEEGGVLDVALEIVEGESVLEKLLEALPESTRARERAALHEGLHG